MDKKKMEEIQGNEAESAKDTKEKQEKQEKQETQDKTAAPAETPDETPDPQTDELDGKSKVQAKLKKVKNTMEGILKFLPQELQDKLEKLKDEEKQTVNKSEAAGKEEEKAEKQPESKTDKFAKDPNAIDLLEQQRKLRAAGLELSDEEDNQDKRERLGKPLKNPEKLNSNQFDALVNTGRIFRLEHSVNEALKMFNEFIYAQVQE